MESIIISIAAVIVAIIIPVIIAHKQNKIALFEKRCEAYETLKKYLWISQLMEIAPNSSYRATIALVFFDGNENEIEYGYVLQKISKASEPLKHMPFLFKKIQNEEIEKMMGQLGRFISAVLEDDSNVENYKVSYTDYIRFFQKKHNEEILKALKMW